MCSMCHHCEADLTKSKDDGKIQKNVNSLKSGNQDPIYFCKSCGVKLEQDSIKQGVMSPYVTPVISPTTSLSSGDRSLSSCSEFSVDINGYERCNQEEGTTNSSQEDLNYRSNGPLQNLSIDFPVNGIDNTQMESKVKENHSSSASYIVRDVEITESSNGHEAKDNGAVNYNGSLNEETGNSYSFEDDRDAQIWQPPEPEDPEDDMEGSVAFNDDDDDDECGDGTKWGKPSSLSPMRDEGNGSYSFKEERQRTMEEVINGKFKTIVCQLLKYVGISSAGEDGQTWVDVVTSLSWEAASFLKPDAVGCKAMDPDGYVKVKCIATGVRNQSQVIKGLVFKKHAAHKHMATKYKNPKLLLIRGVLGQSSSGLSSFDLMEQEKDYLKSVIETIELCHPNVILVEKSVSRDIQESILSKGMTLVFDMKLHRLERVARCTGSPILSSDTLMSQKLKQCDSFRIEKFVEEHAGFGEGGKKPSKTLMFLEGCPTRLGCTILLKGANSDELKRIKCVVQCAVVMAYHLILETSFLVDQKAMFSTIPFAGAATVLSTEVANVLSTDQQAPQLRSDNSRITCLEDSSVETGLPTVDIPISNGFHGGSLSSPLYEPYNPAMLTGFSSLSDSLKKVIGDNFPLASSSYQSLSTYFGFNGRESINDQNAKPFSCSTSPKALDHYTIEDKDSSDEDKSLDGGQSQHSLVCSEAPLDLEKDGDNDENNIHSKDGINGVLDSQSILVLMSRRNALRGSICEQSHFSHIMFYRNFDVPLGKFLNDNLLNQRSQCSICGQLPEAHFYYYAHHNKQLTIQVRRLPNEKHLPGEAEGKLWMWSRCGKCKPGNKISKSSKRVLISTSARGLSFGKFLELGFSHNSSSSKLSSCGHSLHWDFLYFFGLGPMAAMFKYSPFTTYTVSVPPEKIQFSTSIRQDWLMKETQDVYMKGMLLFIEVENSLKKVKPQFEGLTLNIQGSLKVFSDIEEMLKQERTEFEVNIQKIVAKNGNSDKAVYKFLNLNRLLWELLLESCIWDRRIHSLLSRDTLMVDSSVTEEAIGEQMKLKIDESARKGSVWNYGIMGKSDVVLDKDANAQELNISVENEYSTKEIPVEGPDEESGADPFNTSTAVEGVETPTGDGSNAYKIVTSQETNLMPDGSNHYCSDNGHAENFPVPEHLQVDRTIPISSNVNCDSITNSNLLKKITLPNSLSSDLEYSDRWFWTPFAEIRERDVKEIQRIYLQKFESISSYTAEHLPTIYQLITEEGQKLHIPLGSDAYIVSDYEGELSSIIACALVQLKDLPLHAEISSDDGKGVGSIAYKTIDSLHSFARVPTISSSTWTSTGSSDSDSVHSLDSRFSSFDGSSLLESLFTSGALHPVVPLGKSLGKDRYTVLCPYAKQFRDLRSWCCPSELDYIASLGRCKTWDAKGGKSKSFFAKTLDDRLIIKEIKRTEFESFMKFAEDYFKYMKQSFELGNQTCLAKVLGIYQVIVRNTKGGKESRHDLMVMENLTFSRNITRQYDLKGALRARYNSAAEGSGDVLLDQNFVDDMKSSPLYVSTKAKRVLERAVWNDTTFLDSINVMDYSLLVGVDTQKRELVCGIIDYLRQYTWDKQLETWVKSSLAPKNVLPTVISPIEYKRRFRRFMTTHFLVVPDNWCSNTTSERCQLCGVKDNSTPPNSQNKEGLNGFSA